MLDRSEEDILKRWNDNLSYPVVTIGCTTYNQEEYIEEALDGFLMQETDFPFEIVINDDCSTDRTAEIIWEYEQAYPNIIKPLYQKENQHSKGVKIISEYIFSRAKGDYIAICEGDDYWIDKEKLQLQVEAMREQPDVFMSFHAVKRRMGDQFVLEGRGKQQIFGVEQVIAGGRFFCSTPSLMFNRYAVESLPDFFYDAPVGDYYLQILGAMNGGALYLERAMAVYRVQAAGSWSSGIKDEAIKRKFFAKTMETLGKVDSYLEGKYTEAIDGRKSDYHFHMAVSYLNSKKYKEFSRHMEKSRLVGKVYSMREKMYYRLRYFPRLLLMLTSAKALLKR